MGEKRREREIDKGREQLISCRYKKRRDPKVEELLECMNKAVRLYFIG